MSGPRPNEGPSPLDSISKLKRIFENLLPALKGVQNDEDAATVLAAIMPLTELNQVRSLLLPLIRDRSVLLPEEIPIVKGVDWSQTLWKAVKKRKSAGK